MNPAPAGGRTSAISTPLAPRLLGSVPYLNARPLVIAAESQCDYAVPSELAASFAEGKYEAALLPSFEAVRGASATVADGICIGCDGPVFSVFLAYRGDLESVESVGLDPDSRTSSHLLQIVMQEFLELDAEFTATWQSPDQAHLLIGDPAIAFRQASHDLPWNFLDLGEAWKSATGLPFVFAVWMIRDDTSQPSLIAEHLREMKSAGLAMRVEIAASQPNPTFAAEYITRYIRYDLGNAEKESLALYAALLRKVGLVAPTPENMLTFV